MNKRLIIIQALIVVIGVLIAMYQSGLDATLAAAYGGGVAIFNTLWLNYGVSHAGTLAEDDPKSGVYSLYFGAVQRFVFVLVALGVGLAGLKLKAEPLLLVFGVAQLAFFFAGKKAGT